MNMLHVHNANLREGLGQDAEGFYADAMLNEGHRFVQPAEDQPFGEAMVSAAPTPNYREDLLNEIVTPDGASHLAVTIASVRKYIEAEDVYVLGQRPYLAVDAIGWLMFHHGSEIGVRAWGGPADTPDIWRFNWRFIRLDGTPTSKGNMEINKALQSGIDIDKFPEAVHLVKNASETPIVNGQQPELVLSTEEKANFLQFARVISSPKPSF